jgi:hypothetical protein
VASICWHINGTRRRRRRRRRKEHRTKGTRNIMLENYYSIYLYIRALSTSIHIHFTGMFCAAQYNNRVLLVVVVMVEE